MITVGSLFTGIGGFDAGFEDAGMETIWQCEIDPRAQKVLRKHWPDVKLIKDVKNVSTKTVRRPDLICGGFPCQDLSVAGKRKGLDGARSGLWFEFHRVITEFKPERVVIENVPGLLSSNKGKDLQVILDGLEALGYVVDIDILDSQCFGVAQRRRRVFIVCQHIDSILGEKTPSSAQTITQCLMEILGAFLIEAEKESPVGRIDLDFANSKDGLLRRIKLFGIAKGENLKQLLNNLVAENLRFLQGGGKSERAKPGRGGVDISQPTDTLLPDLPERTEEVSQYLPIEKQWQNILDGISKRARSFTISVVSSPITILETYTFAKMLLSICEFIAQSNRYCPTYWNAASSALTTIKEYISYARQTSESLFTDTQWVRPWRDFIGEAEQVRDALICTGITSGQEVLFESESLCRNPTEGRTQGEGSAAPATSGTLGSHKTGGVGERLR